MLARKSSDYSIIANNCIGADISKKAGMRFNSPTVNLQILPGQYCDFLMNLDKYLKTEMVELKFFSKEQREAIRELYGRDPEALGFPFGILGNRIVVCLQHYNTFQEGYEAWNRRKSRVKEKRAYIMALDSEVTWKYASEFRNLKLPNRLLFLISATGDGKMEKTDEGLVEVRVNCPKGKHFMNEKRFLKSYYEEHFSGYKWLRQL